ncbi:hypothetical protein HPB47_011317 [Ixodes persulcatus]|uniref:Uncharacterized protein n=1 Tax=Ixodes persulcatus TaxID=34615 RepID=A0AC60NWL4_IXOPE|nr:hypothetical protein HPB47_011317 [Ixodes persulcatus]
MVSRRMLTAKPAETALLATTRHDTLRDHRDAFETSDARFVREYRLTKGVTRWLCDQLRGKLQRRREGPRVLTVEQQVLPALHFYAAGCFQGTVGSDENIRVHQCSNPVILGSIPIPAHLSIVPACSRVSLYCVVHVKDPGIEVDVTLGVETLVGVVAFTYENFASGCLYPPLVGWDIRLQVDVTLGVETLVGVVAFTYENFASGCLYPPLVGWDIRLQVRLCRGLGGRKFCVDSWLSSWGHGLMLRFWVVPAA